MSDNERVVYRGRYQVTSELEGDGTWVVLDDWDVLPLALYPHLDGCRDLVVLDPLSFPFDSLRRSDRSIRLMLRLPADLQAGLSMEDMVVLFDQVVLRHLGFEDRLVIDDDDLWDLLRERYHYAQEQRIVPDGSGPTAALDAATGQLDASRFERVVTPIGIFHTLEEDLITTQLVEYGGHQRGDLAMLLSVVRPGDVVLDVGAHIGTFSIPLGQAVGPEGHVFAFEPAPRSFQLLERNVKDNGLGGNVTAIKSVVSDTSGRFRALTDATNTGATAYEAVETGEGEDVGVTTVDDWWEVTGRPSVDVLKIDVEGMEMSVLRGAEDVIDEHWPVIFVELSEVHLASSGASMIDVEQELRELGYDFFVNVGPRNVSTDRYDLRQISGLSAYKHRLFDLLAVHRDDPVRPELLAPDPAEVGRVL